MAWGYGGMEVKVGSCQKNIKRQIWGLVKKRTGRGVKKGAELF
jgi:hypothetical protein